MGYRETCENEWMLIWELERDFLDKPSIKKALELKKTWKNWITEGWANGAYRVTAAKRVELYKKYLGHRINEEHIVEEVSRTPDYVRTYPEKYYLKYYRGKHEESEDIEVEYLDGDGDPYPNLEWWDDEEDTKDPTDIEGISRDDGDIPF